MCMYSVVYSCLGQHIDLQLHQELTNKIPSIQSSDLLCSNESLKIDTKGVIISRTSKKYSQLRNGQMKNYKNDKQWSTRKLWRYQRGNRDESLQRRSAECWVFCTFFFSFGHCVDLSFFRLRLLVPLSCDLFSGTFVMWLVIWYLSHVTYFWYLCHVTCYLVPLSCDLLSCTFVMWLVFWYLCHVTCFLAPLSCDLLSGTFVMWLVIWYLCHVTCYLTPLSCDLLSGTFVMWLVFWHLCHVTCYLAPLSCDLLFGTFVMWLVIWYLCHVT
jgi:hypothetical protein